MDRVFRSEEQPFISELVSVEDFFTTASATARSIQPSSSTGPSATDNDEDDDGGARQFAAFAGISEDVGRELSSHCVPDDLKCFDGDDRDPFVTQIPSGPLTTLQIQKEEVTKRTANATYKAVCMRNLKYDRVDFKVVNENRSTALSNAYVPPDVLLTVMLMKPYNRPLDQHEIRLGRLIKSDACFIVRGCQELAVLRDRIPCASDFALQKDVSDDPQSILPTDFSKEMYPSNFFFFHDTFYVDHRKEKSIDLSENIREWSRRRPKEMGPFRAVDMAHVKFLDLHIRLGQPYLYLHQGSCEHLIVFSDLRLMDAEDNQEVSAYPLSIQQKLKKRTPCCGCKIFTAKWVTYGNERLPFDPAFFCDECFRSFNYNTNGKIGNFKLVPFFDRSALSS